MLLAAVVLLLATLALSFRAATAHQGLAADFGLLRSGGGRETVVLDRSRAVWFPSFWQLLVPYLEAWDESRWGFPAEVPWLDVEWTGIFTVARPGRFQFDVVASGAWSVQIGAIAFGSDAPAAAREGNLAAGDHPVRIALRGNTDQTSIKLYRVLEGNRRLPARAGFFPSAEDRRAHRLTLAGAFLMVAACVVAAVLLVRAHAKSVPFDELRPLLRGGLIVLLLATAVGLRLHERSLVPWPVETADEYYGAWAGWSLVHEGQATAWSWYTPYRDARMVRWFGHDFRIVTPYFDQPPFAYLLTGLWGTVSHPFVQSPSGRGPFFRGPPLGTLRVVPIVLSCVSMLLILHLGRRLFSWPVGFAGALIHATTPVLLPLHRLLKEENFLAPLALGALVLALEARDRPARRVLVALGALCGLSLTIKFTALFVPVMCGAILLTGPSPWRRGGVLHVAAGTAAGAAAVLLFAALQGWDLFWAVTSVQGSKPLGLLTAARILFDPRVVYNAFGPAWSWWIWLAAVPALALRGRPLALAAFLYVAVIAASAGGDPLYGWYAIPLYALLTPAAAWGLVDGRSRVPVRFLFWMISMACSFEMLQKLGTIPAAGHRLFFLASLPILLVDLHPACPARVRSRLGWGLLIASCLINAWLSLNLRFIYGE